MTNCIKGNVRINFEANFENLENDEFRVDVLLRYRDIDFGRVTYRASSGTDVISEATDQELRDFIEVNLFKELCEAYDQYAERIAESDLKVMNQINPSKYLN